MALAVSLRVDFVDAKNKKSFTKIRIPTGFALADYIQFGQGAAQVIANASDAQITGASVCFAVDLSGLGLRTVAIAVSKVARKAVFRFRTAVTGFFAQTIIPTLNETKVGTGSEDIDQIDLDVAALTSALEDGVLVGPTTVTFTNDREMDITALSTAKERFRRRRAS